MSSSSRFSTHAVALSHARPSTRLIAPLAGALLVLTALLIPGSSQAADSTTIYFVQGLPGKKVDVTLDDKVVASGVEGAQVKGPFRVSAGKHSLNIAIPGQQPMNRTMTLEAGSSTDAVLHLPAQAGGEPMITSYTNDLSKVAAGKATLQVAHTAAVPAADVVVDGTVLFQNIANGEALTLIVPADSYTVKIVPTGKKGPAILGPATLPVKAGSLNAVYAFGDPDTKSMNVAVHTVAVGKSGSGQPSDVDTGTGGQAAGFHPSPWSNLLAGTR